MHGIYEVPTNAVIHTLNGKDCYVSGISTNSVRIRYLHDGSFEDVPYNEARALYMPFSVEPIKK